MLIPFFVRINQQALQITRAPKARAKIFNIVVEFLKNDMGPAVPIGAAGENFLKITYLQILNEILPLFTVCKGWTVYACICMPWHYRSLMAYAIATPCIYRHISKYFH